MNADAQTQMDDEHDDDQPVGRVLNRREVLALFGATGAAILGGGAFARSVVSDATPAAAAVATVATATTTCVATPELTEGPYFVDEKLVRSDIRVDPADGTMKAGVPLALTFAVTGMDGTVCTPLAGATVDMWHCDAVGLYSDEQANGTVGQKWLRGAQTTDADGLAPFTTIYPGWYQGRAVHIHFKIRTTTPTNAAYEFTSQLFFDETLNDAVLAQLPYRDHRGTRLQNSRDGIYAQAGSQLLLTPTKTDTGYAATFAVGLDLTNASIGQADGNAGPGGGGPPAGGRGIGR